MRQVVFTIFVPKNFVSQNILVTNLSFVPLKQRIVKYSMFEYTCPKIQDFIFD